LFFDFIRAGRMHCYFNEHSCTCTGISYQLQMFMSPYHIDMNSYSIIEKSSKKE